MITYANSDAPAMITVVKLKYLIFETVKLTTINSAAHKRAADISDTFTIASVLFFLKASLTFVIMFEINSFI
jgi:hypothetical protein